jgi:hypothetical protein
MKTNIIIAIITIVIIYVSSLFQPADPCSHLDGADYDWCHLMQMKGA